MDTKALKDKILQLAIQGKLVEQNPNDEPASVLLARIAEKKESLIKEGKIKKDKPLPHITEDEITYELPNGWAIDRLGNIASLITKGSTPTTYGHEYQQSGINFIKVENVKDGKVQIETITQFISEETHSYMRRSQLEEGDILFSIAGTIGETCIIKEKYLPANTNQAFSIIRGVNTVFVYRFLEILLLSIIKIKANEKARGGAMNNISLTDISNFIVVIPPFNEQKRIVEKVDELFSIIDDLENNKNELLEAVNNTRNKVLQEAVQGKLVPQDSNDEPASVLLERIAEEKERLIQEGKIKKEKALPPITDDEIPYELPNGWEWVRLGYVADFIDYRGKTPVKTDSGIPLITAKNVKMGYISAEPREYIAERDYESWMIRGIPKYGDVIFTTEAPLGNVAQLNIKVKFALAQRTITFKLKEKNEPSFLKYALMSKQIREVILEKATGTTAQGIKASRLKKIIIPIPPINEQKRIVEKVDQLMALCDELEKNIEQSKQDSELLMQSVLQEAFKSED